MNSQFIHEFASSHPIGHAIVAPLFFLPNFSSFICLRPFSSVCLTVLPMRAQVELHDTVARSVRISVTVRRVLDVRASACAQ